MWDYILEGHHYFTYIFEFLAAFAGIIYLKKMPEVKYPVRLFTYYLVFIFIADLTGLLYPTYAYFNDYKYLEFLRGTPFAGNEWLYNSLHIVTFSFYAAFFRMNLNFSRYRKILKYCIIFFILASIIDLAFFSEFFNVFSYFVYISGTVISLLAICFYYFELLYSDEILNFSRNFTFYASVGILIYSLCIVPGIIYYEYARLDDTFRGVYLWTIKLGNAYLYLMFAIGYYVDYKYRERNLSIG